MKRINSPGVENSPSIKLLYSKIWQSLSKKRKSQILIVAFTSIFSGMAEVLTLAIALPSLNMIMDVNKINNNLIVQRIVDLLKIKSDNTTVLIIVFFLSLVIITSMIIRVSHLWISNQLAARIGSDLSCKAYLYNLSSPYEEIIENNSSGLLTMATNHVAQTVNSINSLLQLLSSSVIALFLVIALMIIDWKSALFTTLFFSISYLILALILKKKLSINDIVAAKANRKQVQSIQEGLGSIRDIILDSSQKYYFNTYKSFDLPLRLIQSENAFLGSFPRYTFESIGLILITLLTFIIKISNDSSTSIIPILGTIALGALKLLPILQNIYNAWASIRSRKASVYAVVKELNKKVKSFTTSVSNNYAIENFNLEIKNLSFKYKYEKEYVLENINLDIIAGEKIGIIGSTGSGKSTLVDLLMGLLIPTKGEIIVNQNNLHKKNNSNHLFSWQSIISHVPQHIYLSDSTFAENIAYGIRPQDIDWDMLFYASKLSHIFSYIESTSNGFNSFVGERGIKISGGQRQRIGIARAIYKRSKIIIFDEATSALDRQTEAKIIESINNIQPKITTISVAHRLGTLINCEKYYEVKNKKIQERKKSDIVF